MKVYITIVKDGCGICGIDSAFSTREKAEQYLISTSDAAFVKRKYGKTVEEFWTKAELDDSIEGVEVK